MRGDRPRMALVVPSLKDGGGVPAVARFIKDVVLRADKFDLRLISLSSAFDDPLSLRLFAPRSWINFPTVASDEWEGLPLSHVGAVASEFEFQRFRPRAVLSKILTDCDLIQVVCGSPAWAYTVCGLGKPVAVHCATRAKIERGTRDADPKRILAWWRKGMTVITDKIDDRVLQAADGVQVMNPWMLDYTRKLNSSRNVDVRYAPPGVNAALFCPLPARDMISDPYILCVGRLDDPRKNISLLLEAYSQLPDKLITQVRLMLAGSAAPPDTFWQRAHKLGLRDRIAFVSSPDRQELVSLYQRSTVFALSSDEEGFGMVLIEAMACGIPVVSTSSGGPDGIITDGQDGYLVPLDDATTMADRLASLLQDKELNIEMGRKARETVERRYDEKVAGAVFVEMWDRMLAVAGIV